MINNNGEVKNIEKYLEKFKSKNTQAAAKSVIKKLGRYIDYDLENVKDLKRFQIDLFVKKELNGKSEATISNVASRLKDLCVFYENDAAQHLNLDYIKTITQPKKAEFLSPVEVYLLIQNLVNYQDKALVLLTYIGFYDNNFETIRHLRKDQFKDDSIVLDNGRVVKLNKYCSRIIEKAINETVAEKYAFSSDVTSFEYDLKNTPYIIKARDRKDNDEVAPTITLKKRFEVFAKLSEIEGLSPIMLKNSKYLYDLVKLEYDLNGGNDISQLELERYCKENGMRGSIGKLNLWKKQVKDKIIKDIKEGRDIIHQ